MRGSALIGGLAALCLAACSACWLPAGAAAAPSRHPRARIWIVDACGEEVLRPATLPYACPGAGGYPINDDELAWRSYGHATAEATARFSICLREAGLAVPAPPSMENLCYGSDVTWQEVEKERTVHFPGAWRFWHVVRCRAIAGKARGHRLFYGVTGVRYAAWPWREWTTNTDKPRDYACPKL